jgi:hypothetical protein
MNILSSSVYSYVNSRLGEVIGNYFEIGVFNGTGLAQVAQGFPLIKCYAVDPFIEDGHTVASSGVGVGQEMPNQLENCLKNIEDLDNVILHQTTSTAFFKNLTPEQISEMNIGMAVIDGDHHYPHVVNDLQLCLALLENRSGYIVVDDTDVPDVKSAYTEFIEANKNRIKEDVAADGATRVLIINPL